MKRIFSALFVFALTISLFAQQPLSENARVSILTASPWDGAVWAVYGHTAVRVVDPDQGLDLVFNYGFFNHHAPNFLFLFVRGRANYWVETQSFPMFLLSYAMRGVRVIEQILDLTQEEKQNLFNAMYINALPENRYYLYSFLFDNCVTRPRDLLEQYVQGMIYPEDTRIQTFRNLIHECVSPFPWMQFGIDLVIGGGADSVITLRDKMFLPAYFQEALAETMVMRNGVSTPLVKETIVVVEAEDVEKRNSFLSPMMVMLLLLLFVIFVSRKQRTDPNSRLYQIVDTLLFGIVGAGGLVIFFLMFFSIHPAVNPNWNLMWMNPLALVVAILFWIKKAQSIVSYYHIVNFAVLSLFLLSMWMLPQWFNGAIIPLIICLWLRSGTNWFLHRKCLKAK